MSEFQLDFAFHPPIKPAAPRLSKVDIKTEYFFITTCDYPALVISASSLICHFVTPNCLTWLLFLQLKNGGEIKLEPLSAALVRSVAAITSQSSLATAITMPGAGNNEDWFHSGKCTAIPYIPAQQQPPSSTRIHQERAPRYFSLTQSGDPGHPETELNSSPLLPIGEATRLPLVPTSSADQWQQGETVEEGWKGRQKEEVGGRQQGGAREDIQGGKLQSSSRDREDGLQHHQLSAEPPLWRDEPELLPSRRAADGDSQRGDRRGRGGELKETGAAHASSLEDQAGTGTRSQGGFPGMRCSRDGEV